MVSRCIFHVAGSSRVKLGTVVCTIAFYHWTRKNTRALQTVKVFLDRIHYTRYFEPKAHFVLSFSPSLAYIHLLSLAYIHLLDLSLFDVAHKWSCRTTLYSRLSYSISGDNLSPYNAGTDSPHQIWSNISRSSKIGWALLIRSISSFRFYQNQSKSINSG